MSKKVVIWRFKLVCVFLKREIKDQWCRRLNKNDRNLQKFLVKKIMWVPSKVIWKLLHKRSFKEALNHGYILSHIQNFYHLQNRMMISSTRISQRLTKALKNNRYNQIEIFKMKTFYRAWKKISRSLSKAIIESQTVHLANKIYEPKVINTHWGAPLQASSLTKNKVSHQRDAARKLVSAYSRRMHSRCWKRWRTQNRFIRAINQLRYSVWQA